MNYSIDIETLGTNNESTILSIGICAFNMNGNILNTLEINFYSHEDKTVNATLGTIRFWLEQATSNPKAVTKVFYPANPQNYLSGLKKLSDFIENPIQARIWANGTKFDLSMIESLYKKYGIDIPWRHNSDRCMRTLKEFTGKLDVDMGEYKEVSHTALSDAIWQAKYIAKAYSLIHQRDKNV